MIVDRVDLDDVQRVHHARLRDELEGEMRLAVREPAAHGIPHAGRDFGVDDVEVDRDVNERAAPDALERLRDHRLHAAPVEVADRVHSDPELADERLLARIQRTDTNHRHALRIDGREP